MSPKSITTPSRTADPPPLAQSGPFFLFEGDWRSLNEGIKLGPMPSWTWRRRLLKSIVRKSFPKNLLDVGNIFQCRHIKNPLRSHWTPNGVPCEPSVSHLFLLFLNPNKVETVQPMRSCRKSSGVITPALHTNASINREAIDVTAALLAQMDLNLHFWYSPDNSLFFHTSAKTAEKCSSLCVWGKSQRSGSSVAAMWQSSLGYWGCWSLALSFLCLSSPPSFPRLPRI